MSVVMSIVCVVTNCLLFCYQEKNHLESCSFLYCIEIGYLDMKSFTFEILFCNDYEKIPSRLLITVYKDIYP